MDLRMDQENSAHSASHRKSLSDVTAKGLSVRPKNGSAAFQKSSKSSTDNRRKALGDVSNLNIKNDSDIQKPKKGLSVRKESQECSTSLDVVDIASKLSFLAPPSAEKEEEEWPEIEFQPEGDPETDEDFWSTLSLPHVTADDVERLRDWQPEKSQYKPVEASPPLEIECPDLRISGGWLDAPFIIYQDFEDYLDNDPTAFVPLD